MFIRQGVEYKFSEVSSSDNYREVMISTSSLEVFVYCLVSVLKGFMNLSSGQFGLWENTPTLLVAAVFRNTFEDKFVYVYFVYLSKASERVKHIHRAS